MCSAPEYSVSELSEPGTGNVAGDPGFVDATGGDFHLASGSVARDLVPSDLVPSDLGETTTDYDGNPRPVGDGKDAGAFERQ